MKTKNSPNFSKISVHVSILQKPREFLNQRQGSLATVLTEVHLLLLSSFPFGLNPLPVLRAQTPFITWRYHQRAFTSKKHTDEVLTQSDFIWACAGGFVTALKYGCDYVERAWLSSGQSIFHALGDDPVFVSTFFRSQCEEAMKNGDNLLKYSVTSVNPHITLDLLDV